MDLLVRIGPERHALPLEHVLEVVAGEDVFAVLGAPAPVLGVCNLRGQVLPVVDAGSLLGIGSARPGGPLVLVEAASTRALVAVDDVLDVSAGGEPADDPGDDLLSAALLIDGYLVGVLDVAALLEAVQRSPA